MTVDDGVLGSLKPVVNLTSDRHRILLFLGLTGRHRWSERLQAITTGLSIDYTEWCL